MANQFVVYPYTIDKSTNGGYIVTGTAPVAPADPEQPAPPPTYTATGASASYVFASMSDLASWMELNEQEPAV